MTNSERIILRTWMQEVKAMQPVKGDGTQFRIQNVARRCGVDGSRVYNLIHRSTFEERNWAARPEDRL